MELLTSYFLLVAAIVDSMEMGINMYAFVREFESMHAMNRGQLDILDAASSWVRAKYDELGFT